MKIRPKKAMLIGLASSVLFSTAGCVRNGETDTEEPKTATTENNIPAAVYGPPEVFTEEPTVEDNELPDVYGPPEDF